MAYDFAIRIQVGFLLCAALSFAFSNNAFAQSGPVSAIFATSDGKLVVGSDHGLHFHDAVTLERKEQIESNIEKIYAFKVSADGKSVAASGGTPSELGVVEIYSLPGFKKTHRFERFKDVATDVAWLSNEQLVACSMTGNCCMFELDDAGLNEKRSIKEGSEHLRLKPFHVHSKGILALDVLANGQIVSCGLDSTIRVWEPHQSKDAQILNNHLSAVNDIDIRPQVDKTPLQTIVSASDDGTIRFWQPTIGRMLRFVRLDSIPNCVIWNHDGTMAIAGCRDGAIRVIDPANAKVERTIKGSSWIHCLAIGRDRNKIFVGSEKGISITELNSIDR